MNANNNSANTSKNYNLSQDEENDLINYINQLLIEFENQLELFSIDSTYFSIIPLGRKICQTILELLIKKEGYDISNMYFIETIDFSADKHIIRRKYYYTLNVIEKQANEALSGVETKFGTYLSFLKIFSEFIDWFNLNYSKKFKKISLVNDILLKINSILDASNYTNIRPNKKPKMISRYKFLRSEEVEDIQDINKLLTDYEKQLKIISSDNKFYYTFLGSTIMELMLKLLLKKEGMYKQNENYSFYKYAELLYEQDIIPKHCEMFIKEIGRYKNEFIQGKKQSNKLVLSFLKAFNYFLQWFNNYYFENYNNNFQIVGCCELINSITYDEQNKILKFIEKEENPELKLDYTLKINEHQTRNDILKLKQEINLLKQSNGQNCFQSHGENEANIKSEIEKEEYLNKKIETLEKELKTKEKIHKKQIEELEQKNDIILIKLEDYSKLFKKCINILEESNERGKRIESKIDDLHFKIDTISNQIKTIQSYTERLITNAQSTEEIEKIIETYVDSCIENIMQHSMSFSENQNYKIEKQKLIYSIGENGWNKLSEKSKTFLITSKVMYNHLITMDDIIDYSGICVLVTKALEVEMSKRFFTNFLEYLNKKYGKNYKKYHTALLHQKKKPLFDEKFTMGNISFVMCYTENRFDTYEEKQNNKQELLDYCKNCIFSTYNEYEIKELLTKYAASIEGIRKKYRNPSAHTNEIKRIDAEECFNLVIDVEKLLKHMLDSFDN